MRRAPFRVGVESLESRAVLSTAHAALVVGHGLSLHGRGTGAVVSLHAIPNGSYETVSELSGTIRALGPVAAEVVADFAPNQFQIPRGTALIVDQAGDELFADVTGGFKIPRHGATHATGRYHLAIVGGTGAFAGATGTGHIDVLQNVSNGHLTFAIGGRVEHP